jgi:catalase (peroxidase I)
MAMNDEETVALIAGGHTFGKAHGAHKPAECVGLIPPPRGGSTGAGLEEHLRQGQCRGHVTSGLEGAWSANPIAFTTQYLDNLFQFDLGAHHQPGRRQAVDAQDRGRCADRARCPSARRDSRADDVHHRHRAEGRPGVPRHRAQFRDPRPLPMPLPARGSS